MPNVTAPTRNDQNGQSSTYFLDSVSTTSTTYTYPAQQDTLTVTNKGNYPITLTVNGTAYTIQGGGVQTVPQLFTSFTIVATGPVAFDAMAISETTNTANVQLTGSNVTLDVNPNRGDTLVKVPFRPMHYYAETSNATANYNESGVESNEDGSGSCLYTSVPYNVAGAGVRIHVPFYGRVFGVRYRRDVNATDFSVAIDGVSYGTFRGKHDYLENQPVTGVTDGEGLVIVSDQLPDGIHYAEINVPNPISSGTNGVVFYGLLLDRRAGYSEIPRANFLSAPQAVTVAAAAVFKNYNSPLYMRSVRKVMFTNTTASPITITIQKSSTTIWQKSVPANDSLDWDLGSNTTTDSTVTYQASATGVNATVVGGY